MVQLMLRSRPPSTSPFHSRHNAGEFPLGRDDHVAGERARASRSGELIRRLRHQFGDEIILNCLAAAFATIAAILDAAERNPRPRDLRLVDAEHAGSSRAASAELTAADRVKA